MVIAPTSAACCTVLASTRTVLCLDWALALLTFHAAAPLMESCSSLLLADPAPPSRTDCPRAQGRHRPNKPPPASAAAHHISAGPPPDAIRPRREQTRCSHFGSQAIPHPLLQPLAHFQQPADRGTAAPPTSLPSYKWCVSSVQLEMAQKILEPCTSIISLPSSGWRLK